MSEQFSCEVRFEEDPTRQSPGRLTGTLIEYEKRAKNLAEMFGEGSLEWDDGGVLITEQHSRSQPIVRAIPFVDGRSVKIDVPLPNTARGRDTAVNVREGVLQGLSVEFVAQQVERRNGMRFIKRARLVRASVVDSPEYAGSGVEVRHQAHEDNRPRLDLLWR